MNAKQIIENYTSGSLYLSGCDLKGVTLPTTVGGSLYLSGCDLKGVTLPKQTEAELIAADMAVERWKDCHHERNDARALALQIRSNPQHWI